MIDVKVAHVANLDYFIRHMLLNQMSALREAGYEVVVISGHGPHVPFIEECGFRHITVSTTRTLTPVADLVALWRFYRVMRRERFTVVHTHNPKPNLLGQIAARLAGVPVVVATVHGFYFHDDMRPALRRFCVLLERLAGYCSDLVFSQSSEDVATAIREKIVDVEKIVHLGNGVNVSTFNPQRFSRESRIQTRRDLCIPDDSPVVGFIGRLVKEKGLVELLQAAQIVVKECPAARFLIVGPDDPGRPDAVPRHLANTFDVQDNCIFTGWRGDTPELYASMDVFVLPSHREGFPRSLIEASASSLPCVATQIRGCREAVEDGRNGVLFPKGDVASLAAALLGLLQDPARAARMGAEGRKMAVERFDERQVVRKILNEYARLLEVKRQGRRWW